MGDLSKKSIVSRKIRIKDAFKEDAGRGIIRIDPEVVGNLNLKSGDVIEIYNPIVNKKTAAILMTGNSEDKGKNVLRIDPSLRRNLNASIDDYVEIRKIIATLADSLTLTGLDKSFLIRDVQQLTRKLDNRIITKGDNLSFYAMGRRIDLAVIDYLPDAEAIKIHLGTKINISEKITKELIRTEASRNRRIKYEAISELEEEMVKLHERVTYEDIGGLEDIIQKVREIIELPIRHPELFTRIGIDPPKGVLLYGPPGTGKTLIARAVAFETDANFISINGPEIMSKFFGQSEENIRRIFEEAKNKAPTIIFLDELDSIAPQRNEGKGQVESRIVAQLLSLMDGLEDRGEIIVIGATNKINNVDIALRRPGRFDREIEISVPNVDGRFEILLIHTRGMPLSHDLDLKLIARKTHGFVGADLKALCKEAAILAIRDILPSINLEDPVPEKILNTMEIKMMHFLEALTSIEPSALREVTITRPNESWDDIGGLDEAKQQLMETIEWPLKYPRFYNYMRSKPPLGILLYGLPGTGKTLLAKALAHETEVNFISVKGPEFLSKWVGESAKAVRETFKKARSASPCIIFFDEIDSIASRRAVSSNSRVGEQVLAQMLTEMDGLDALNNVILLAATNRPDILDPAILRSGRFGLHIEVPLPNKNSRMKIFKILLEEKPLSLDVNIEILSEKFEGYTGADIKGACEEATLLAIRRGIYEKSVEDTNPESYFDIKITMDDFNKSIDKIFKSAEKAKKSYQENLKEPIENLYG